MARPKEYHEAEVVSKAMELFWRTGYKKTTARMMEEEMGINLFSIYSSFGSKQGVFTECLKAYKQLNQEQLLDELSEGHSIDTIEHYFRKFLLFTKSGDTYRGCLLINSAQELGPQLAPEVGALISDFSKKIQDEFLRILSTTGTTNHKKKTNYLFQSLVGLITTTNLMHPDQIDDHLEIMFSKI